MRSVIDKGPELRVTGNLGMPNGCTLSFVNPTRGERGATFLFQCQLVECRSKQNIYQAPIIDQDPLYTEVGNKQLDNQKVVVLLVYSLYVLLCKGYNGSGLLSFVQSFCYIYLLSVEPPGVGLPNQLAFPFASQSLSNCVDFSQDLQALLLLLTSRIPRLFPLVLSITLGHELAETSSPDEPFNLVILVKHSEVSWPQSLWKGQYLLMSFLAGQS